MSDQIYKPNVDLFKNSHCKSMEQYKTMYEKSLSHPEQFWGDIAKNFHFERAPTGKFMDFNFNVDKGKVFIKFLEGGLTNICYNCLDRHVNAGKGDDIAFYW